MLWFITLTDECNLKCTYCGGGDDIQPEIEDMSFSVPKRTDLAYDIENLRVLEEKVKEAEDEELIICFYGGEPLLNVDRMVQIMNLFQTSRFVLQTNGTLLNKVQKDVLSRFSCLLVSVDGDKEITDKFRGKGTYQRVINNIRRIRDSYTGEIIARMTVTLDSDIEKDVLHLLQLGLFDYAHWQLDTQWDSSYEKIGKFAKWRDESYNPGITRLMGGNFVNPNDSELTCQSEFMNSLRQGKVLGIVPFTGLYDSLLNDKPSQLRCGSGLSAFNISPGGGIEVCPIAPNDFEEASVGVLSSEFRPSQVLNSVHVKSPCTECEILSKCGGRCLYANKTKWWGEEGFLEVCKSVQHLIDTIEGSKREVRELLVNGTISEEKLFYPSYNNSCEIIP